MTTKPKASSEELPILLFETPDAWAAWLDEHGATSKGLWVRLAKKAAPLASIDYQQTLEVALCYGWIDGQKRSYDDQSWLQKFTPRGRKSMWSKINREKVEALIARGQMRPAGLAAVEAAKRDGRWDAAYDSQRNATVPDDLQAALDANPQAQEAFGKLNGANRYAILFRIHQAKRAETRAKRIAEFVAMLERGEQLHA